VFTIQDYTGEFPQDSTALLVQRGLNGTWQTVTGDYFGATGEFPAQLDTGERRVAGSYTPLTASTQTVRITTEAEINVVGRSLDVSITPATRTLVNRSSETVTVSLEADDDVVFENATLRAVFRNADRTSSTILANKTVTNLDKHTLTLNLQGRSRGTVDIVVDYRTQSVTSTESATYGIRQDFQNEHALLTVLGEIGPRFPEASVGAFQSIIVLFSTVLVSTLTASRVTSSELVAGVALAMLAAWSSIGWISYGVVFAAGAGFVGFAAIRRGL
jgi:hypothetical protein